MITEELKKMRAGKGQYEISGKKVAAMILNAEKFENIRKQQLKDIETKRTLYVLEGREKEDNQWEKELVSKNKNETSANTENLFDDLKTFEEF